MSVSRSLRFQILRRDSFTCRYCGRSAPDVPLEVDHVIAEALGGSSDPSNLVTSCEECNGGKAATPADAATVEDVAADALRWRQAVERAAVELQAEHEVLDDLCERFRSAWEGTTEAPATADDIGVPWDSIVGPEFAQHSTPGEIVGGVLSVSVSHPAWATRLRMEAQQIIKNLRLKGIGVTRIDVEGQRPASYTAAQPRLPPDWRPSIERFLSNGLTIDRLCQLAESTKTTVNLREPWRWFCKKAWNEISALQESARRIIETESAE